MRLGVVLFIIGSAAIIRPAQSQSQAGDGNRMQAFTRSEFYQGLINRALASVPQAVFKKCPTLVSSGSTVTVMRPISFGEDGFPNAGIWKQTFPVSGCGNDTILNFYFSAGTDEKINTVIGQPGTTHASLTLQRDALPYVTIGARLVAKDCNIFDVKNTKFEGYGLANPSAPDPGPNNGFRPWWETWTVAGCDRTVDVPIDFKPDDKGTQIIQPGGAVAR
jgi:hypothetical protein